MELDDILRKGIKDAMTDGILFSAKLALHIAESNKAARMNGREALQFLANFLAEITE